MTEHFPLQQIEPDELPAFLSRVADEEHEDLAIAGPHIKWLSGTPESWPEPFRGRQIVQVTGPVSGLPRELLRLHHLVSLTLCGIFLTDANTIEIAKHLRQLTTLNLRYNRIGEPGAQAIAENLRQLTTLELGYNQVGEGGARAIAENLDHLEALYLGGNLVGEGGAQAITENLGKLKTLDLRNNRVGDAGARAIAEHLSQLKTLDLRNNQVGDAGARAIGKHLGQLTRLILWCNQVGNAGARAISEHLSQLKILSLGDNDVNEPGARVISEHLGQLTALELGNSKLSDASVAVISKHLRQLDWLDLSSNKQVTTIAPLSKLPKLTMLSIANTGVADLSSLKSHVLGGAAVKWSLAWWEGPGIYVENCRLTHPAVEVVKQGPDAVLNYFRELEAQGEDQLFEAKVLIVGEGGAGKTSLIRRLYQPELSLPAEDETTRGINVHRHHFLTAAGRDFRINVWDFGGQQIYHATHQFFLTKNSLYVLVDDAKSNHKSVHDDGFKYWLEVIETLSERSPVLIFQNEKGGRSKQIDEAGIKSRFPNVVGVYRGNLEHPDAVETLRAAVEHFAQELPHIGDAVPKKWVSIRESLEELAQSWAHILQDEYFRLYEQHLELDQVKALYLSRYLHNLGVYLHFQQSRELRRTVFLQNQWVTDAVFQILDDEVVKAQHGRFTLEDCDRLWTEDGYENMELELRALMVQFELCYQLPDTDTETWLAPQLLSPSKPQEFNDWATPGDLVLTYRYEFLPKGLVSRLIVRMHRFVKQPDLCWSQGVLFEQGETQVLVETAARGNEIGLRARGPEGKALLSVIASDLDALNASFEGLADKVGKWVPCVCENCSQSTTPAMFAQKELLERKHRNKQTIECPKPDYPDVSVLELLDGLRLDPLPDWATEPESNDEDEEPTASSDLSETTTTGKPSGETPVSEKTLRVFLASSEELREDRDAFELYFLQQNHRLRKQGLYLEIVRWENFLDAMSETRLQDEYNKAIRDCDIFVSLFKTKTGKFTDEEFDVAHRTFDETGRPRIYTYFRKASVSTSAAHKRDLQSLWEFQDKLKKLEHFSTEYDSIDGLQKHFRDQLDKLRDENRL